MPRLNSSSYTMAGSLLMLVAIIYLATRYAQLRRRS